jgi:hypothetical protein
MTRKVTHEIKLPKSLTVAIYIIAVAFALNVVKPFVGVAPAFAELGNYDTLSLKVKHSGTLSLY